MLSKLPSTIITITIITVHPHLSLLPLHQLRAIQVTSSSTQLHTTKLPHKTIAQACMISDYITILKLKLSNSRTTTRTLPITSNRI